MSNTERLVQRFLENLANQDGWRVVRAFDKHIGWAELNLRGTIYEAPCRITEAGTPSVESLDEITIKGM